MHVLHDMLCGLTWGSSSATSSSSSSSQLVLRSRSTATHEIERKLQEQDERLDRLQRALDRSDAQDEDLRSGWASMMHDLKEMTRMAGQLLANTNKWKANTAAQHLDEWFQYFDRDASGGIDVQELQRGLERLGMDSHSHQAKAIVKRYAGKGQIDAKQFSRLVRDVQLLLTFDQDGSGTLDADELLPALLQLGLHSCTERHAELILRAWDVDGSGRLDLLEFTDLVRSLQAFSRFDLDGSGDIDLPELREALHLLGLPVDSDIAQAILRRYDADASRRIELHEFAVLVRDISLFTSFDRDGNGVLDADELLPALRKLGLSHKAIAQVTTIVATWDENGDGQINLLEFVTLVRDLKVFTQFDRDGSGTISAAELRLALRALGTNVDNELAAIILAKYDRDRSGVIELHEFSHLVRDLPALVGPRGAYEDPFAIDFLPSNPMAC